MIIHPQTCDECLTWLYIYGDICLSKSEIDTIMQCHPMVNDQGSSFSQQLTPILRTEAGDASHWIGLQNVGPAHRGARREGQSQRLSEISLYMRSIKSIIVFTTLSCPRP